MSFRRRMMMMAVKSNRLPNGYTKLDYIYTTNNAYINTGITIDNNDEIYVKYQTLDVLNGDNVLFGARDTSKMFSFIDLYGSGIYSRWGGKTSELLTNKVVEHIEIKNNITYIYLTDNNVVQWNSDSGAFEMITPITLFAYNDAYNSNVRLFCKNTGIISFKVKGKLDYQPCLNTNNIAGMYDYVSRTFFPSDSLTPFIAGNPIQ